MNKFVQVCLIICFSLFTFGCASSRQQETNTGMIGYLSRQNDAQWDKIKELEKKTGAVTDSGHGQNISANANEIVTLRQEVKLLQEILSKVCGNQPQLCTRGSNKGEVTPEEAMKNWR